jgi:glucose-1-phosphate adenylyltransferase
MDYRPMIDYHLAKGADLTIGVMPVPLEETHRFGIMQGGALMARPPTTYR